MGETFTSIGVPSIHGNRNTPSLCVNTPGKPPSHRAPKAQGAPKSSSALTEALNHGTSNTVELERATLDSTLVVPRHCEKQDRHHQSVHGC